MTDSRDRNFRLRDSSLSHEDSTRIQVPKDEVERMDISNCLTNLGEDAPDVLVAENLSLLDILEQSLARVDLEAEVESVLVFKEVVEPHRVVVQQGLLDSSSTSDLVELPLSLVVFRDRLNCNLLLL